MLSVGDINGDEGGEDADESASGIGMGSLSTNSSYEIGCHSKLCLMNVFCHLSLEKEDPPSLLCFAAAGVVGVM